MIFWSVLSALALLVAGWYGRDIIHFARGKSRSYQMRRRRRRMYQERELALNWVVRYYQANDPESLFRLPNGRPIPYLSRPSWRLPRLRSREIKFQCNATSSPVRVDARYIRRRLNRGEKVWDGKIFCLRHGIMEESETIRVNLARGTYFQYVCVVDQLTDEAVACAKSPRKRPELRDRIAQSIGDLQSGRPQAQLIGFAVAFLLADDRGWKVLIQQRSFETGVASNQYAVVPAFVVEPIETNGHATISPFQDFLREISEELYANRHHAAENVLRGDWYLENEDVQRLQTLHASGKLHFEITGFGFDALTAEMNLAGIAVLNDPETARSELRRMQTNWEVAGVRAYDFDSPDMDSLVNSPSLYPTSAFALSCAREWLALRRRRGQEPSAGVPGSR